MRVVKECDIGYDIIEDIKKVKENVSIFDMCGLPQQRDKLLQSLQSQPSAPLTDTQEDPEINGSSIGGKSKSQTLPFLLTFEIFNHNVHNFLVDSRAS